MRILISFCCFLISTLVLADSTLPAGCQPVSVKGESLTLQSKKGPLVFIHNLMPTDLWITHPVIHPSASAGWSSRLQADHWSALTLKDSIFVLNCIESKPGHEQQIPCEGAIAVCAWSGIKLPKELRNSTVWAAEDKSLDALTPALNERGIQFAKVKDGGR